jgi:hypothetical protein
MLLEPRTVGELIAGGLRCHAGDEGIGWDMGQPLVDSLNTMLERLAAEQGLSFVLRKTD